MLFFVGAGVFEEQDGDAAGGDVVAAEGGDEAVELVEPPGALAVGGEVDGAAVDAGFDAPLGVGDEGGLLVALDCGGDVGLPVGALDEVEEVAVEVADEELAFVGLGGEAVFEAGGEELPKGLPARATRTMP